MKDNIIELWPEPDHNLPPRPYRVNTTGWPRPQTTWPPVKVQEDKIEDTQTALDIDWLDQDYPHERFPLLELMTVAMLFGLAVVVILTITTVIMPWAAGVVTRAMGA